MSRKPERDVSGYAVSVRTAIVRIVSDDGLRLNHMPVTYRTDRVARKTVSPLAGGQGHTRVLSSDLPAGLFRHYLPAMVLRE